MKIKDTNVDAFVTGFTCLDCGETHGWDIYYARVSEDEGYRKCCVDNLVNLRRLAEGWKALTADQQHYM